MTTPLHRLFVDSSSASRFQSRVGFMGVFEESVFPDPVSASSGIFRRNIQCLKIFTYPGIRRCRDAEIVGKTRHLTNCNFFQVQGKTRSSHGRLKP